MALPQWLTQFFNGKGSVMPPLPGNTANPPGDPNVQAGNYQFIDVFAFQGSGASITDVPLVPTSWQNWDQMAINQYDASGLTGGGISNGQSTNLIDETTMFFDTQTGIYYDLGEGA